MRRTGYHRSTPARFDVQMTPMIDVVFQLLIFFVCTVDFQRPEQALQATPKAESSAGGGAAAEPLPPELEDLRAVEIVIERADGRTRWTVNRDVCRSLDDVTSRLTALAALGDASRVVPVVLNVADDVPLGDAIDVYDCCLRLGFAKIAFALPHEP